MLTQVQLARYLHCRESTARRLVRDGEIPSSASAERGRNGRYARLVNERDADEYMRRRRFWSPRNSGRDWNG